ncbi:hypothetical protein LK429_00410 [Hoylesella buccalis]|uniref:hypothetical protein n=1 Tax=Hoylesella buccalis TaxID=28127 RepID=UPI001D1564A6|nr:hypothetical protein [Hoylesella buccalis]UEA63088.1 hypothetical protein LK429_00410 [Hoylesella buccalis]UWP49622.1 hypothetical protein NQ518_00705 [Hoylesella buccalis ATCC 35310]
MIFDETQLQTLVARLSNAAANHCQRTAKARIRDIAKIYEEQNICSYKEKYNELIEKYGL